MLSICELNLSRRSGNSSSSSILIFVDRAGTGLDVILGLVLEPGNAVTRSPTEAVSVNSIMHSHLSFHLILIVHCIFVKVVFVIFVLLSHVLFPFGICCSHPTMLFLEGLFFGSAGILEAES